MKLEGYPLGFIELYRAIFRFALPQIGIRFGKEAVLVYFLTAKTPLFVFRRCLIWLKLRNAIKATYYARGCLMRLRLHIMLGAA